jgi:hypothetical protein
VSLSPALAAQQDLVLKQKETKQTNRQKTEAVIYDKFSQEIFWLGCSCDHYRLIQPVN